jgi:inorganic pyrophosphatase/exopolyphosphatase
VSYYNPLGSTSTLVALSYEQQGIKIDPAIAGLLMAGLISGQEIDLALI